MLTHGFFPLCQSYILYNIELIYLIYQESFASVNGMAKKVKIDLP